MSGKAKFRLLLLVVLAGVCGYVGFLVFRERDPMPPIVAAERAIDEGRSLEKLNQPKAAAEKYDQANVLLEHATKRLSSPANGLDKEQGQELSGKVFHMKAVAIRDKYYALAAATGKPLPDALDSVTNQPFRNFLAIPDSKDREEAIGSVRGAALLFLMKNPDVQLDAMRIELMQSPINWENIDRYSKAILDVNPNDSRAKYLLARYEFEQPQQGSQIPTPMDKRSPERVKNARRYIDDVKLDEKFPVWRTEFVRAQIHRWLMKRAQNKREKEFNDEMDVLDQLLLDDNNGAIARIRAGEGMAHLGAWDVEAILGLHAMAADLALEMIRKRRIDYTSLTRVYQSTLEFCKAKVGADDPQFTKPMLINALLNLMGKSQTILATNKKQEWQEGIDTLRPLLRSEFENQHCEPYQIAQFAELLMREAQMQRPYNPSKATELREEAKKWFEDGVKFGKEHNLSNFQMMPFNMLAANVFYFNSDKRDELAPFLAALTETKYPQAKALALVIDGALDERDGRLEKARWKMELALRTSSATNSEEEVRAHASLANIYMAMGQPENALVSLNKLHYVFDRYGDLSEHERQWMGQFLRSPQEYYALLAIASLEDARKKIVQFYRANPKAKEFPLAIVKESEDRVQRLLKEELPQVQSPGYNTRIAWVQYLMATRRRGQAAAAWEELNRNFSDRVDMLTLRVGLQQLDAFESGDIRRLKELPGEVDKIIGSFIQRNPTNQSAKLYLALWLAQTKRSEQAMQMLKQISEESATTPELRRVIAAVALSFQSGSSPMKIVQYLPRDPRIDDVLVFFTRSAEAQTKQARMDMTRHEQHGLSLAINAEDLYFKGKYKESAEAFASTLDFTRIKALAQNGIIRSMFAFAAQDPEKALQLNVQLCYDYPKEPAVYLTYAYVCLVRDEIGLPTGNWEMRRTMGSALNEWEVHTNREGVESPIIVPLTRAEFWLRANRIDVAKAEMQRALHHDRQNPIVLSALIRLILDDPARDRPPVLREYLAGLKRVAPEAPSTLFLTARVEEYMANWKDAIPAYEHLVEMFPDDRNSYMQLINMLELTGDFDRAAKWVKTWRTRIPIDLEAVGYDVRILVRKKQIEQARAVGATFVAESLIRAREAAEKIKMDDAKEQEKARAAVVEDARCKAEFEIARGFLQAGALDEAEARINQLPASFRSATVTQEVLGDIYLKGKQWAKAEAVFEPIVQKNRTNLGAVNNLAYLLAEHRDKPNKAREAIINLLRIEGSTHATRPADRFPPDFLATVGAVYVKLDRTEYAKEMYDFFKTANERYPNEPRIMMYFGYAHELLSEFARAESYYNRAIEKAGSVGLTEAQRNALLNEALRLKGRLPEKMRAIAN